MPRELVPLKRKREPRGEEALFPRTSARVLAGPKCDRMMHPEETENRRKAKQALRELMSMAPEHVRD